MIINSEEYADQRDSADGSLCGDFIDDFLKIEFGINKASILFC